jgi:predicted neuraminidase
MIEPKEYDLVVVGAGMSGFMAAMAAKAEGNSVLIIEPSNVLGGQGTAGGVAGFCGDTYRVNHLFKELIDRLAAHDFINPYNPNDDRREYELEWCAYFLQEMAMERGIEILLCSRVIDAVAEAGVVTELTVSTAGGVFRCKPRFVVDASGICVVPVLTGFPVITEGANKHLPMSLYFTLWDTGKPVEPFLPPGLPAWANDDEIPMTSVHEFESGKVEIKMKVVGFDAADGFGRSQAEMFARRQMVALIYYLQTRGYMGTVFDTHVLASVSRGIGVREERRIVGEHVLTTEEVTHAKVFQDAIAVNTYHLDFHWTDKMERAGTGVTRMVDPNHIPLRAIIPKGAKNMLVPGRGLSAEQLAMSSFRVMGVVQAVGFAAGRAIRQCLENGTDLQGIDVAILQSSLEADGQILDLSYYGDYMRKFLLTREYIFEGERPFAQCHASTLVQVGNYRFLAAWFGGTREGKDDVGIWMAQRFEGQWSEPTLAAKVAELPHWNPVLFRAPDGTVHLYFKVGAVPHGWRTWEMTSADDGVSWSEPVELAPEETVTVGPSKNQPVALADGTWLAPNSQGRDGQWDVFVDRSSDCGATWERGTLVPLDHADFSGKGAIQPTLWESAPGCVHMLVRTTEGRIWRSDSKDGGVTWAGLFATDLPNNNSGVDVANLRDGTLALVYNHTSEPDCRTPLRVALSFDNGDTWPHWLDLESDDGEYSYPTVVPTTKGLAISYTWKRKRIAFWHGSIEQITMKDVQIKMGTDCPIAYTPAGEGIIAGSPCKTIWA